MAFSLIGTAQAQASNSPTTTGIDTTGADLLVASVHEYAGGPAGTVSDSKGNTWHALTPQGSGATTKITIFYAWGSGLSVGAGHTFSYTAAGVFAVVSFS